MKKTKILAPALLSIAACGAIVAGSTYALFTSEAKTNVSVASGKVAIKATIGDMKLYHQEADATGNYSSVEGSLYQGTAVLDEATQTLAIDKMVPMDKITFNVNVENESNVAAKYRTVIEAIENSGLYSGLTITVGGEEFSGLKARTDYADLAVGANPAAIPVSIELPLEAGNEYMGKSCTLSYKVEAIQGNAFSGIYEVTPDNAQSVLDSVKGDATVILKEGDYGTLYLRQDLSVSTRRSDLDVDVNSYPAYYRAIDGLTIKAAEGATVTCDGIEAEAGLYFDAVTSAPASNHEAMGRSNTGFISYLSLKDVSIEGIAFDDATRSPIVLGDNSSGQANVKGSALLVDNFLVKNCKGTGDASQTDNHFFAAGTGTSDEDFLDTGKKALNNLFLIGNEMTAYYQPICFNNASAVLNGMTIKGNSFVSPTNNVVQMSNKEIKGEIIFSGNAITGMNGRFARIAGASSDSIFRVKGNSVVSPIQYDSPTAPEIFKITAGAAGFTVYDSGNDWAAGDFTNAAKTTWIANGDTSLIS